MCFFVTRAVYRSGIAFSRVLPGGEGLELRKGAHSDVDRARHTARCVGCEKNNGSAVETEPHGGTSATGDKKTRNINRLAQAALEREEQEVLHRVDAATIGQFAGVNTRKQPWRRERGSGGEDSLGNRGDSLGNRRVPERIHPVIFPWLTCDAVLWRPYNPRTAAYNPLTATRTGPWPWAAGAGGEAAARHSGLCGRRAL